MSRNGFIAALASAALILSPLSPAMAGGGGGYGGGMTHMGGGSTPDCPNMGGGHGGYGGHGSTLNIYKPININKNINIFKPVVVNKNIDINKNININKNIIVNKNIVINKVNAFSSAEASAFATAAASASAGAASQTIVYSGSYSIVNYNGGGRGGSVGALSVHAGAACHMQEATVVKALHAVCVTAEGREFPASHMIPDTWIDQSYEGEIARCIPGAHLKITIGEVVQSDQGMAGTYDHGAVLLCGEHEAVRQFQGRPAEMHTRHPRARLHRAHQSAPLRHRRPVLLLPHPGLRD